MRGQRDPAWFDRLYQEYAAAPSDREALRILYEGLLRASLRPRLELLRATLVTVLVACLLLFGLEVWPTPWSCYVDAGHDVVACMNRLSGQLVVRPLDPPPRARTPG